MLSSNENDGSNEKPIEQVQVHPAFSIVPNGISEDGLKLRATVLISPFKIKNGKEGPIRLSYWPSEIGKMFEESGFSLALHWEDEGAIEAKATNLQAFHKLQRAHAQPFGFLDRAWQVHFLASGRNCKVNGPTTLMMDQTYALWPKLAEITSANLTQSLLTENISDEQPEFTEDDLDSSGRLIADAGVTTEGKTPKIKSVLSNAPADTAFFIQRKRAKNVEDRISSDGENSSVPLNLARHNTTSPDPNETIDESENGPDELKRIAEMRLKKLVEETEDMRKAASNYVNESRTNAECSAAEHVGSEGTSNSQDVEERNSIASHLYGTYAQSERLAKEDKTTGGVNDEQIDQPNTTLQEQIRQRLSMLQGSPALARLFQLVIDIEFDLPKAFLKKGEYFSKIYVEKQDGNEAPIFKTALKLKVDDNGLAYSFLPAPRLEFIAKQENTTLDIAKLDQMDGVLRLGQKVENCKPRYALTTLDVGDAIEQIGARQSPDQLGEGETPTVIDHGQLLRTVGFALMDRGRAFSAIDDMVAAETCTDQCLECGCVELHAEELTVGFALDVQLHDTRAGQLSAHRWRSLMNRFVRFEGLEGLNHDKAIRALVGDPRSERRADLEQLPITTSARMLPRGSGNSGEKDLVELIVDQSFAVWDGSPMGVTAGKDFEQIEPGAGFIKPGPKAHFPVRLDLDLPSRRKGGDSRFRPPPLRFGQSYCFGMRAIYAGGSGLNVAAASDVYQRNENNAVLPHGTEIAKTFRRNESVLSPAVLMTERVAGNKLGVMGYETSNEVILRSGKLPIDDETQKITNKRNEERKRDPKRAEVEPPSLGARNVLYKTSRIIMPPAVAMVDAALHSVFDAPKSGVSRLWREGALPRISYDAGYKKMRAVSAPGLGDADALITRTSPAFPESAGTDSAGVAIFEIGRSPKDAKPYYPDPQAREYVLRLRKRGSDVYEPGSRVIKIYEHRDDKSIGLWKVSEYQSLRPLEIKFERAEDGPDRPEGLSGVPLFDWRVKHNGIKSLYTHGRSMKVQQVTIRLEEADDFELHICCVPSKEILGEMFALPSYMAEAETGACTPDDCNLAASRIHEHITKNSFLPEIAAVTTIDITHAVNRPAKAAMLADGLVATRLKTDEPDEDKKAFSLSGEAIIDAKTCDTIEIEAEMVAPRETHIDDPARGRSLSKKREQLWPIDIGAQSVQDEDKNKSPKLQNTKSIFGFTVEPNGKVTLPKSRVSLLRADNLPNNGIADDTLKLQDLWQIAADKLSVTEHLTEAEKLAKKRQNANKVKPALQHDMPDTKARKMSCRVVGMGRHANHFTTQARYFSAGKNRYLKRTAPLERHDQIVIGPEREVWLPSNAAPAQCEILTPEPSFVSHSNESEHKGHFKAEYVRRCKVRLRLKRPWFLSGEGERLGVVLRPNPNDDFESFQIQEMQTGATEGESDGDIIFNRQTDPKFYTQWGRDPIKGGYAKHHTKESVPLSQFSSEQNEHAPKLATNIKIKAGETSFKGNVLTYEPYFDVVREEWFVDVELTSDATADPFVKFALVRFQPHVNKPEFYASEVTYVWTQLLPERRAEIQMARLPKFMNGKEKDDQVGMVVCVEGAGHQQSHVYKDQNSRKKDDQADLWQTAIMTLKLVHESQGEIDQLRRTIVPGFEKPIQFTPTPTGDKLVWRFEQKLHENVLSDLGPGTIYAYVEEIEYRLPATFENEPIVQEELENSDNLKASGPRFAARMRAVELD